MRTTVFFAALFCGLAFSAGAGASPRSHAETLDRPAEFQGIPCDKGEAWFYDGARLKSCVVSRETGFGEGQVPKGSKVVLRPDGAPAFSQMGNDADYLGYACRGSGSSGAADIPSVAFYPSGKLEFCFLSSDQVIQGIPCARGNLAANLAEGRSGAYFHENGKLRSCLLSRTFGSFPKGALFTQAP